MSKRLVCVDGASVPRARSWMVDDRGVLYLYGKTGDEVVATFAALQWSNVYYRPRPVKSALTRKSA